MSQETELYERVARIEQQLVDHAENAKQRTHALAALDDKLDGLEKELARYRGLVGGVLLIVTALVAFFRFFWGDAVRFFSR